MLGNRSDNQAAGPSIRPYRRADRPRCAEIYVAARRVAFPWVPADRFTADDFVRDTADEQITVAEGCSAAGGLVVLGVASGYLPGRFIHHLYVDPDCRRRGIGAALIGQVVGAGPGPWRLKCVEANTAAMAFYRARGWVEEGRGSDRFGPYVALRRD